MELIDTLVPWFTATVWPMLSNGYVIGFSGGALGMLLHAFKKWLRWDGAANFRRYLCQKPKATMLALFTYVMGYLAIISAGDVPPATDPQTVALAITSGFTMDSGLNKWPEGDEHQPEPWVQPESAL